MPHSRASKFRIAIAASAALVLAGPYIGQARAALRAAFSGPAPYALFLNTCLGVVAVAAVVIVLARLRRTRLAFTALLGLVVFAVGAWLLASASSSSSQTAVGRFHFVEYGVISWLFCRAVSAGRTDDDRGVADPSLIILPVLYALLVGIADEWFQWFVPERVGEWPDILLNASAIAGGALISFGLAPPRSITRRWRPGSRATVARAAALVILALAAFLHTIHLGTLVRDDEIGVFRSRYSNEALRGLSDDRAARWASAPPPATVHRFSREDQYLAEAEWHVYARNTAWDRDLRTAWFENRILEKYFAPAIDVSSYVMPVSRWPAAQRADAERRLGTDRLPFESHAERLHLYLWSPWALWGVALAAVSAIGVAGV